MHANLLAFTEMGIWECLAGTEELASIAECKIHCGN